ncbi:nuclear transport factor 2 family protein [Nocardioides dubius]|uniref:SnoaL-like domain-containing protein n=1 Tax=Nocardioides dubius TaxID=317019 RepID=A0ABN1TXM7_9ACTN
MDQPDLAARLQSVVDDLEIRRVVHEYAARVDLRDWTALRRVLADDVEVNYHNGRTIVTGGDEVVEYIRTNTAHLAWQHHNVTPYDVQVNGDHAAGRSYLISHQVLTDAPTEVLMMAAFYDCEFVRVDGAWRLHRMVHQIKVATFHPIQSQPTASADIPPAVQH